MGDHGQRASGPQRTGRSWAGGEEENIALRLAQSGGTRPPGAVRPLGRPAPTFDYTVTSYGHVPWPCGPLPFCWVLAAQGGLLSGPGEGHSTLPTPSPACLACPAWLHALYAQSSSSLSSPWPHSHQDLLEPPSPRPFQTPRPFPC